MNKATSEKLALTTFCANVLILLHHANLSEYVESIGVAQCVMNFFSAIAQPGMTWFFLVSAYLFFRKIEAKDFKRKFQSRIRSLLIPYLLWNTIAVLLKIALGTRFDSIWTFFRSTYLFYGNTGVANGPLWYLFRLMEFVVLAPIIYIVVKRKKIKTTIGVCILLSAFNIVFEISYFGFTYFLPVYIIGAFVGVNYADKVEQFCAKKVSPHYSDYYLGLTLLVLLLLGLFSQNIVVYGLRLISRYAVVILAPMLIRLLPEKNRQSRFISGGAECGFIVPITSYTPL